MSAKRRAYFAWIVVCIVWGTTYLAIRVALESIPPLVMAGFRYTVAGLLLIAILRARGERLPATQSWGALAILGVLLLGLGNGGVVWAEQYIPSGMTAVLVGVSPFWMVSIDALVGRYLRRRRPKARVVAVGATAGQATPAVQRAAAVSSDQHRSAVSSERTLVARRVAGLIIGFAGIVMLVWPELAIGESRHAFLIGFVSTQIACVGWALGSSYARDHAPHENVLSMAAFEMTFGGIALFAAGAVHGEFAHLSFQPKPAVALGYLIVFGAVVGFSAYAYALKHLPVATVSLYAYVNPVIAVILGTVLLGEPFTPRMGGAAAVVLTGMALVRRGS